MPQWFDEVLEKSSAFIPHGHCYLWIPSLLWLHVISDTLIGMAYVGISFILYLLVRKIRLPFSPIFVAFGLFIGLCGLTHFLAIWTVWNPDYWLDGLIKAATAAASVATAIGLFFIRPQVEEVVHAARLSEERREQLETTNAELQALYRKLKEADELKSQFFANVSHELRTPLALILGPAETLLDDPKLDDGHKRQLESIRVNGKSLLKQVNDLLDVAKLEEGKMEVEYVRIDLAPWFKSVASQFSVFAEQRGLDYRVLAPTTLEAEVDPDKIERIVVNLLSNAFKFTPAGGTVTAQLSSQENQLRVDVLDTGPGINEEQQSAIFERFRQADGSSTRRHGGTGLGLAIAKDFTALHGGSIGVTTPGEGGAHFTVVLPATAPAGATVREVSNKDEAVKAATRDVVLVNGSESQSVPSHFEAERPTVLVVEDTAQLRLFVAELLGQDYNVITAEDGKQGLEEALALPPDIIVSDIMMPGMSGDELVAAVRTRPEFDSVPILLLSAKADDELRENLLRNGAQDYVTKPFRPQELLARVANLVALKRTGDTLREELADTSGDVEALANELTAKHNQLKLALEAVEIARAQAEQSSQVKTHFLAMISHEMRTPLATIQMNAQFLNRKKDQPDLDPKTHIERMIRASQQLSTLIEGLLEYTRVESGRIMAKVEQVDMLQLAREVIEMSQLQVTSLDVSLELAQPENTLSPFLTDPRLLRVVLSNLVSNALKFTKAGEVSLHLREGGGFRIFEVHDTGIGIPAADIPRIFLPFEQLEPVQRKSIPGVGLGLAVTKEIVEALGGRIEVESHQESGSIFRVYLPELPADQKRRADPVHT